MKQLYRFYFLLSVVVFNFSYAAESDLKTLDDYQKVIKDNVGDIDDKRESCIRHALCLTDSFSVISEDFQNNKLTPLCPLSFSTSMSLEYFYELAQLNKNILLDESCPAPLKVVFNRYFASDVSTCKNFTNIFGHGAENSIEIFEGISSYIESNQFSESATLKCGVNAPTSGKESIPTAIQRYRGLFEGAIESKDYYAAKVYGKAYVETATDSKVKANTLSRLGDIDLELGNMDKAIELYQASIDLHTENNDVQASLVGLQKLLKLHEQSKSVDKLVATHNTIDSIYRASNDATGQAQNWFALAMALNRLRQFSEAIPYIIKAIDIYHENGLMNNVVELKVSLAANYSDMYQFQELCNILNEIDSNETMRELVNPEHRAILSKKIDCSLATEVIEILGLNAKTRNIVNSKNYPLALAEAETMLALSLDAYSKNIVTANLVTSVVSMTAKYAIYAKSYIRAESIARDAIAKDIKSYAVYQVFYHSLFLQKKYNEAFEGYLGFVGRKVNQDLSWEASVMADLKLFNQLELIQSDFDSLKYALFIRRNPKNQNLLDEGILYFDKKASEFNYQNDATSLEFGKELARTLMQNGQHEEGVKIWKSIIKIESDLSEVTDELKNKTRGRYARALSDSQKYSQAKIVLESIIVIQAKTANTTSSNVDLADNYNALGFVLLQLEQYEEAHKNFTLAHSMYVKIYGDKHVQTAISKNNIGKALLLNGDAQRAIEPLMEALAVLKELLGEEHDLVSKVKANLQLAIDEKEVKSDQV